MTARDDFAKVLAEHDLKNIRPAMPGPGSAWTCRCLQFGVSQNLTVDHERHVADALLASPALARLLDEARAEAWDEGARAASPHGGAYLRSLYAVNPYRKDTP